LFGSEQLTDIKEDDMPSRRERQEFQMLSERALRDFSIFCAAGRYPRPDRRAQGAFDQKGQYDLAGLRSREGEETAEQAGLDDDFDPRRETANGVPKLSRDQGEALIGMLDECSTLADAKECVRSMTQQGEDEDPEPQESIEGSLSAGDPDPHLRTSAGDRRRPAMDAARLRRAQAHGKGLDDFLRAFPEAGRIRQSY
jgi:hypothetical protein